MPRISFYATDTKTIAAAFVLTCSVLSGLVGCSNTLEQRSLAPDTATASTQNPTLLVVTDGSTESVRQQAANLGLEVSGQAILQIRGRADLIAQLTVDRDSKTEAMWDEPMATLTKEDNLPFKADEKALYMAKEDFGLLEFLEAHPTFDGRSAKVGVLDDGISPSQSGFQKTTTGERKLIARRSNSNFLDFEMSPTSGTENSSPFFKSIEKTFSRAWIGNLDEKSLVIPTEASAGTDLNRDGVMSLISLAVLEISPGNWQACVDINADEKAQAAECFGTFESSGEFAFWDSKKTLSLMAEFNPETLTLTLSEGEGNDSHGEGVASVLAGHQIGSKFDGVAPGAQVIDYDFTDGKTWGENVYTIGTFLSGLDWVGQKGADVVNISYSLFFSSGQAQLFMQKALTKLIQTHEFVISFSAGNNGPGWGSLNRRVIYPPNVLVNGAYLSRKLDEYVHGNTGLPPEGQVVYYSSRGPGPDGGQGPLMISPLSSLVHSTPNGGFGAFSGTSSASPAMAGLATVLISAARQSGLPVDVTAVVHALRLSAVPLAHVSFIEQGYGLPKITKAFEIYQTLVKGEQLARIQSAFSSVPSPDGLVTTGLVLDLAQLTGDFETSVSLTGFLSDLPSQGPKKEILKFLNIEYTNPIIRGPSKLWVSTGSNAFQISVLASDFEKLALSPGSERAETIRLIDPETGLCLHQIPVTFLRKAALTSRFAVDLKLPAGRSQRLHFSVPSDVVGYRVVAEGDTQGLQTYFQRLYDAAGMLLDSSSSAKISNEILLENNSKGYLQWALFRRTSTEAMPGLRMILEPIRIKTLNTGISTATGEVTLTNLGSFPIAGRWALVPTRQLLKETFLTTNTTGDIIFTAPLNGAGEYTAKAILDPEAQMSNMSMFSCMAQILNDEGKALRTVSGQSLIHEAGSPGTAIQFTCRPFEQPFTIPTNSTGSSVGAPTSNWKTQILFQPAGTVSHSTHTTMAIPAGNMVLKFGPLPKVQSWDLMLESVWGKGTVRLGTLVGW